MDNGDTFFECTVTTIRYGEDRDGYCEERSVTIEVEQELTMKDLGERLACLYARKDTSAFRTGRWDYDYDEVSFSDIRHITLHGTYNADMEAIKQSPEMLKKIQAREDAKLAKEQAEAALQRQQEQERDMAELARLQAKYGTPP